MKFFAAALAFLFVVVGAEKVEAKPAAPVWSCKIHGKLKDNSFSVILGVVNIVGNAEVRCMTALGQKANLRRVKIQIRGLSIGPDISFPESESVGMRMRSFEFGLSSLSSIYGEYSIMAGASARLGHARATASGKLLTLTPSFTKPGISGGISFGLEHGGQFGLGVNVSLSTMHIIPLQ